MVKMPREPVSSKYRNYGDMDLIYKSYIKKERKERKNIKFMLFWLHIQVFLNLISCTTEIHFFLDDTSGKHVRAMYTPLNPNFI